MEPIMNTARHDTNALIGTANPDRDYLIVTTRYGSLADLFVEDGLAPVDAPVTYRANPNDVRGKIVCGALPYHLAAQAKMLIVADLRVPAHRKHDTSMPADELRQYLVGYEAYDITAVKRINPR